MKLKSTGFSPPSAIDIDDTPPPPAILCGDLTQKPPRTPAKPTLPGGWLNKAAVETTGYLYSRYRGQKCSSETRTQGFQGQEYGIGESRRQRNCRRDHRSLSPVQERSYASAGTPASHKLRRGRHEFIWMRPGLYLGDRTLLAQGRSTGRDEAKGSVGGSLLRNRK